MGSMLWGCAAQHASDADVAQDSVDPEDGVDLSRGVTDGLNEENVEVWETQCSESAEFDFHLLAEGLSQWEGKRVYVAAFENDGFEADPNSNRRVVLLKGTITDGGFSLVCPRALKQTYAYPSWGVFVDVDGDGRCGNQDVGAQAQLYGWESDVSEQVGALSEVSTQGSAAGSLFPPIGSSASTFCDGYFQP